jgi:glycosyltransferase involved in cell wall biosynthesis
MIETALAKVTKVALLGNSPPRLCGIATFTANLGAALGETFPELAVELYAMNDRGRSYDYPASVVCAIHQDEIGDYAAAAHRINGSGADVLCVQHEYGIFGGAAGIHLLRLLDRVRAPVVVTLHTVLERPDPEQRAVIDALARRASRLVVMAEKGRDILTAVHGIAADRIAVVPHGVVDRDAGDPAALKARLGFAGRRVLLTSGLISPGKGLETMIRALPAIAVRHPDVLYVILGATHPHLVEQQGEAYREGLAALAAELGVRDNVRLIDGFLPEDRLIEHVGACDAFVTPYLNEAQLTSGTLSMAVALGRPVLATPYWHAIELLGDGAAGMLAPFGDAAAFAEAAIAILSDPARQAEMGAAARALGRRMVWPAVARAYVALFQEAMARQPTPLPRGGGRGEDAPVPPRLDAVERLTDGTGMIQHSIFSVPDRNHGYCVDDNCRALMLMHRVTGKDAVRADQLATVYAAFVQHAWNGERGRFRNFMGFDRGWLESEGSEDSFGRSLWALGDTAARARRHDLRVWASHLFDQVAPHALALRSPRTWAFALLGADAMLDAHPGHPVATTLMRTLADRLAGELAAVRRPGWVWFEAVLAYDNARLPQALLHAGRRLGEAAMCDDAYAALEWLEARQTGEDGHFRAVGTDSFGRHFSDPLPFDQQPLEAWATADAACDAFMANGDPRWAAAARRAYGWYLGANDLGLPIATLADGGCYDGLMPDRANLNQGAESVLAYQFVCCAMRQLSEKTRAAHVPSGDGAASRG